MPTLGTLTLEDAAENAAGNWQRFDSFVWFRDREVEDADKWSIIYTHNRDSGLLDQSNASVIANPHPLLDMAGTFEGNDFDLIVLLEPKYDTDIAELRDAATKTVRPIQRGPQT